VNDYGVGTLSITSSQETDLYGTVATYSAFTSSSLQIFPTTHLDTDVLNAWTNGWNGNGVTVSIIDDFNSVSTTVTNQTPIAARTAAYDSGNFYGKVSAQHNVQYSWNTSFSHGSMVSNIAGGDYDGQTLTATITPSLTTDTKTGCTIVRAGVNFSNYTSDCPTNFYVQTLSPNRGSSTITYKKVAGIAKKSTVVDNNVNLSSNQNPLQTVADIQGHLRNSAYLGVVNLSIGATISTSGRTFDEVMAQVSSYPIPDVDAVVTVAAGNGGSACASADLNGCNAVAVALAFQNATNSKTIVVGALSGSGSSENIATYSTRAGILANRFVLASGEEGVSGVVGTSFAAPRVAGIAAILKQKFPNLNSSQIANIILLSANKDINNDGVNDFTGVSPIFGHGKVSLSRALALAGAM
jgi:subtilisin family serine protease